MLCKAMKTGGKEKLKNEIALSNGYWEFRPITNSVVLHTNSVVLNSEKVFFATETFLNGRTFLPYAQM